MTGQAAGDIRLLQELQELESNENSGIIVEYKDHDIRNFQALIIGPPDSPYALGFYRFKIYTPSEYPAVPPVVEFMTTNRNQTRFEPNIYSNGRICLSIIGTWGGSLSEQWMPTRSLASVLLSIQSLLCMEPYRMQPGFDFKKDADDETNRLHAARSVLYNCKIAHENLRLAVIEPLEGAFNIGRNEGTSSNNSGMQGYGAGATRAGVVDHTFDNHYKQRLLWYLAIYQQSIESHKDPARHDEPFDPMPFESRDNIMQGNWDYNRMEKRLKRLEVMLKEETLGWPARGLELVETEASIAVSLRAQYELVKQDFTWGEETAQMELVDENPFLWRLTYMGKVNSQCEGGVLKVKIYISPNHPVEQPRVFLQTPLFHVRVSPGNALIYRPMRAEEMYRHVRGIMDALEEREPRPEPFMDVNPEATKLCLGSAEERRMYRRKLCRSLEESVECEGDVE